MFPWCDPSENDPHHVCKYAVGDTIFSGDCRGTVAAVGETTVGVIWSDGDSSITYPIDAPYLRGVFPWG